MPKSSWLSPTDLETRKCVHCGQPVRALYAAYGNADLHCPLPCQHCHAKIADPYIERDAVLIFLDLVLHRPQVYRHLLFNRTGGDPRPVSGPATRREARISLWWRLWSVLLLLEAHLQWPGPWETGELSTPDFVRSYLGSLGLALFDQAVNVLVCFAVFSLLSRTVHGSGPLVGPGLFAEALVLSSFAKGLHLLMVIWQYERDLEYCWLARLFAVTSHAEAMTALWPGREQSVAYLCCYVCLLSAGLLSSLAYRCAVNLAKVYL